MFRRSIIFGLLSTAALAIPGISLASAQLSPTASTTSNATTVSTATSASQASQTAITAVGGGSVTNISQDTYQGTAVYDIHVVFNSTVYDVKVSMASGTVLAKKVSSEQPASTTPSPTPSAPSTSSATSASQASQTAITAVGGGSVTNISQDTYQGTAVYDIHVVFNS
ncbi:MAG: PepSY domain-containing protein, partial [Ferrimicrobium sp.]